MRDEVVLIGEQGGERISPEEAGERRGTINYEVVGGLSPRVRRIFDSKKTERNSEA